MASLIAIVKGSLADVRTRIAWPEPGHVRNETWATWRGEEMALARVEALLEKELAEARRLCESIRRHLAEGGDGDVDLVEEDVGALEHLLGVDEGAP